MNIYESCPTLENEKFIIRLFQDSDCDDLLKVYSDKNALPFFNSDNCHGDNFYYPTKEKMDSAIDFWLDSYQKKWFVRWVIVDKDSANIIGSVELFHRCADDDFNGVGVLRIDLGSDYEKSSLIKNVLDAIVPSAYEMFDCEEIISKVPIYAVERAQAFSNYGFEKSEKFLVGTIDHYAYKDYWTIHN